MEGKELKIFPVESGPAYTFGYFVMDASVAEAVVFDVPYGAAEQFIALAAENRVRISRIVLTHSHWDHVADAEKLRRETSAPIEIHADDIYRLQDPARYASMALPFVIDPFEPDRLLCEGETVEFGRWKFDVLHTPGHSEGSLSFVDKQRNLAITGDVLFAGSIGRTDLPGGDTALLLSTINEVLLPLGDEMTILPGHGPHTTIGQERRTNPFLRGAV